jgi:hypothetical protein
MPNSVADTAQDAQGLRATTNAVQQHQLTQTACKSKTSHSTLCQHQCYKHTERSAHHTAVQVRDVQEATAVGSLAQGQTGHAQQADNLFFLQQFRANALDVS